MSCRAKSGEDGAAAKAALSSLKGFGAGREGGGEAGDEDDG